MKTRKILPLIFMMFFLTGLYANLTLDEAIEITRKNNKQLKQAREEIIKYKQDYKDVKGSLFPQLSLSGGFQYKRTEIPDSSIPAMASLTNMLDSTATVNDYTIAGYTEEALQGFIPEKTSIEKSLTAGLELNQVVFMGGKLISGIKIAKKMYNLQEKKYFITEQDVVFETIKLYLNTILAKNLYEVQQEALDIANRHFRQVNNMYNEGLVSEYDKLRAELEKQKLEPEVMQAEKNYLLALKQLRNHLEIEEKELKLTENIQIPELNKSLAEYLDIGLQQRVEIELSDLNMEINKVNYNYQKMNFLPQIGLNMKYNSFAQSENSIESDDWGNSYEVGVGVSMPLFTGFSNTAKKVKASHALTQAKIADRDLTEKIELDIRNSYLTLKSDLQTVKVQKNNVKLAEKGLKIARARYENQVSNQLEILDAQLQLKFAKLSQLKANYAAKISYEKFKKSIGEKL